MEKKEKNKIKLISEGECYVAYMDNQYIKTFNSNFEAYKNYLDAENYFKDYFKQNGYNNVEIKYEDGEYIIEGSTKKQHKESMDFKTLKNKYGDFIIHNAINEVIKNGVSQYNDNYVEKSIEAITLKERENRQERGLVDLYYLQYNTLILKCCNDLHNHFTVDEIMSIINNKLIVENTPEIYQKSFFDDNKVVTLKMEYKNNNQLIYILDSMVDNLFDNVLHQESIEEFLEQMNMNDYIDKYSIEDNEGHVYTDIDDYLENMEEEEDQEQY